VTLPGAKLAAFAGAMPDGFVTVETESAERAKIYDGSGTTFRLAATDATEFPLMAGPGEGARSEYVAAELLREMLRKVKFAAATDGTRCVLCGVNMKLGDGLFEMTATDGRRLAHVEREVVGEEAGGFAITLANKTVDTLCALLADEEGEVRVQADAKAAVFLGERWSMTCKVLENVYPQWKRVVPEKPAHVATIDRTAFLDAMARAALAMEDGTGVKISLKNGAAVFKARSDVAEARAELAGCRIPDGGTASFRFNPRLLKDALEAIDEDEFTLGFGGAGQPVLLKCSLPWLAVVMPLRTK
jgi:DNA polymerase-3 subunit beta